MKRPKTSTQQQPRDAYYPMLGTHLIMSNITNHIIALYVRGSYVHIPHGKMKYLKYYHLW